MAALMWSSRNEGVGLLLVGRHLWVVLKLHRDGTYKPHRDVNASALGGGKIKIKIKIKINKKNIPGCWCRRRRRGPGRS